MNLIGTILALCGSSGRTVLPLAAWLAPLCLLRFVRNGRPVPRLLAAAGVLYGVGCVTWWGMVPVPGPMYFVIMAGIAIPGVIPYLVDKLIVRRPSGFAATLVFPAAWVVMEYVTSLASPYGSWGAVAYTQVDNLPLMQSASVTGLWGIGFLVAWFASTLNWAWEHEFHWDRIRSGALGYASVLATVLLLGEGRLVFAPPASPTVRIATMTVPNGPRLSPGHLLAHARHGAAVDTLRADLHAHEDTLFAWVRREAFSGARLVAWSECGAFVLKDEESAFQGRAAAVARECGIQLVTGVAVFTPGEGYYENVLMAFDPAGTMLARYHKARPVPADPERGADKVIPVFDTALGRVAGAVCFDADFPDLLRRAGRERADLLLIPASDWREIDPLHTRMALVRGIENGCSVVRQTNQGLSAAADFRGRILATTDYFETTPCVMVAQVPVRGVRTWYPKMPDLLPFLCVGVLAFFAAGAVKGRKRGSKSELKLS